MFIAPSILEASPQSSANSGGLRRVKRVKALRQRARVRGLRSRTNVCANSSMTGSAFPGFGPGFLVTVASPFRRRRL
jgi:hypothetical protein